MLEKTRKCLNISRMRSNSPLRGLEPSDYEFRHEKFLQPTIEGLHNDFTENFNIVVWTWTYIEVSKSQEVGFDHKNLLR